MSQLCVQTFWNTPRRKELGREAELRYSVNSLKRDAPGLTTLHELSIFPSRLPIIENTTIRREMIADFPKVQAFYASVGYFHAITADCIVISAKTGDTVVGAVRLAPEGGVLVLRGMMIAPSYQRQGLGTRMLWEVSKFIGSRECFCLPHAPLEGFYGIIGFGRIEDDDAPPHLRERLAEYRKQHWQGLAMRRAAL
jgi:N-acetylglutamate synthase-like GNAT family acetyltransferase